ncbi:hypothetical protein [Cellulosimicrobium sp. CUA-896]|uniref:hypothetical protein n=1 Tax=Cellulosimicrobium sp. CUA-896 TaxID=1517881 RepID=UPI0009626B43|nr:hypothetical protein [Cellulosimicrobium sp. CUA-896]OLT54561.1 hypothetical protein BJF88_08575 [Cellulosimicrobium sp. CUA-896]
MSSSNGAPPACLVPLAGSVADPTPSLRAVGEAVAAARWRVDGARSLGWAGAAAEGYGRVLDDAVARAVAAGALAQDAIVAADRWLRALDAEHARAVAAGERAW